MRQLLIPFILLLIFLSACKKKELVCNHYQDLHGIYDTDAYYVVLADTIYANYYQVQDNKIVPYISYRPTESEYSCHFYPVDSYGLSMGIPGYFFGNSGLELKKEMMDILYFERDDSSGVVAKFHPSTDYMWYMGNDCYRRN